MTRLVTIDYAKSAFHDIRRLNDFLVQQENPLDGQLADFIAKAVTILAMQSGIGRPITDGLRELVIHRGRSGYLVRYRYNREQQTVTVLRIRHQSESGYTAEEI